MARADRATQGLPPVHPGKFLREDVLPHVPASEADLAELMGISAAALEDVLQAKRPVTAGMALRLGKLFGNGPTLWLGMQTAYDLKVAEADMRAELPNLPTLKWR